MLKINKILPTALVNHKDMQKIEIEYHSKKACHLLLNIYNDQQILAKNLDVAFNSGISKTSIMLPVQNENITATWSFSDLDGNEICSQNFSWGAPRDWTIYFMISSHTDIGLHNSQYVQRANSERFIELATKLSDQTRDGNDDERYKYIMEGTWFWNNYPMDKGNKKAREIIEKYVKNGDLGICCGIAGNVLQVFGLEELCRFACERKKLEDEWGVKSETMSMIDNNGLPLSIIQPFSEAGIKNIIFSPNHWHPHHSTVWHRNLEDDTYPWNPNAGGNGSRIDFRFDSELPMVFFWEDYNGNRLLVSGSTQYDNSGVPFGIFNKPQPALINNERDYIPYAEEKTARTLRKMEEKYQFNLYLLPCYSDDQEPNLWMRNKIKEWNEKWKYPHFSIIGNPDIPFNILREKFADSIPVVKGDMAGGWYQSHPSIADHSAIKYQADKLLPIAEKYSTIASLIDKNYLYPKTDFDRVWNYLLWNDEHSYGVSTYRGRRVHETWLQHWDWVNKAKAFAELQIDNSLKSIAENIDSEEDAVIVFNPTNQEINHCLKIDQSKRYKNVTLPKFGYKLVAKSQFLDNEILETKTSTAPIIENEFYKIIFSENGAIKSIFDKELKKELLDLQNEFICNEVIYSNDNHESFSIQDNGAQFSITKDCEGTIVKVKTKHTLLGAEIEQDITLLNSEKKIIINNKILHAYDLYNLSEKASKEYKSYVYLAFPFKIDNAKRYCHLNGALAEYAKDITGYGTDTYMAMHDFVAMKNDDFGIGLFAKETQLIEFDHIHKDKSDFGNPGKGGQIFSYIINDWLQMHVSGGADLNFSFNYAITSFDGKYEVSRLQANAEQFITPIHSIEIIAQKGEIKKTEQTFIEFDNNSRFLTLKPAISGDGLIARFYGYENLDKINDNIERITIDERKFVGEQRKGFYSFKINGKKIKFKKDKKPVLSLDKPLPIGSHYTGLVDIPKATNGEKDGLIYLIWGRNKERNLSHYELYRSESADFKANKKTFVANVYPEPFVIARYADEGLKINTRYYYKVRAVNKKGIKGDLSETFSAKTKEHID